MSKTTKIFIIFLGLAFVVVTLLIMFGGYSYQLKGGNKTSAQNQGTQEQQVDLSSYSDAMHTKIASKWAPPPVEKDAKVVLQFTIQKNGHVINEKIYTSSGIKALDDSALKALRQASPLPPLPLNFSQNSLTVTFDFAVKGRE